MFKKATLLALLLLLASSAFSMRLIDPVSKELSPTEKNFVGTVSVGNTIELIFSKELVDKYESIELASPLADGFSYSTEYDLESIKLFINVPVNAPLGDYPVLAILAGPSRRDKVSLSFSVVRDALEVSPSEIFEQTVDVDSAAKYNLFFVNKTDADAVFTITPNLPSNWKSDNIFDNRKDVSFTIVVPKRKSVEGGFTIYPRTEGQKKFNVSVSFADTKRDFSLVVNARSTIKSKLEAVFHGLPFYSFSLLQSYFANGLLSFLVK